MRTIVLFSLACAVVLTHGSAAQTPPPLEPGSLVRLVVPAVDSGASQLWVAKVGRVLAVHRDSLFLLESPGNDSLLVLISRIAQLEVSRGQRRHTLIGAGIGLLAGGALGVVAGLASGSDSEEEAWGFTAGAKAAMLGISFGLLGGGLGAIVGSAQTEQWVEVPLDRLRLGIAPARSGGVGLSVILRF